MRKFLIPVLLLLSLLLTGCAPQNREAHDGGIRIVTSAYPAYDFARQVTGSTENLQMLTRPGIDPHEYEPTPQNIIDLQNCDVFIYNGGESDAWVDELLESVENDDMRIIRMMDCVTLLEEESVEGMDVGEESHAHEDEEYDEHVWLSPVNVMRIAESIRDTLMEADPQTRLSTPKTPANSFPNWKSWTHSSGISWQTPGAQPSYSRIASRRGTLRRNTALPTTPRSPAVPRRRSPAPRRSLS